MIISRKVPLTCLGLLAAALVVATAPGRARADFKVQYAIGADVTTVTDNGAGDLDPTVGTIFISRTVDQVTLAIVANTNKGWPEPAAQVQDATVNIQNTAGVAQSARITVTDNNFVVPGTTAFICGPPAMVTDLPSALESLGVSRDRVITERW